MADERGVDYGPVIADLEARRDRLNATIAALREAAGMGPSPDGGGGGGSPAPSKESDIRSDQFFGMKVPEAAKAYLGIVKKAKSTNEIAAALEKGGLIHGSSNFFNTVYTALDRDDSRGGAIIKVNKLWGLAAWYPDKARKRVKGHGAEPDSAPSETSTEGAAQAS
jgi:hypothetical protein